jgi:hypothetical protein
MVELTRDNLPVVSTMALFAQMQLYSASPVRERLVYLADRKLALAWEGTDTNDANMLIFSEQLPIPVADYRTFIAQNSHFMVCADTTWKTWQIEQLRSDGFRLELRARLGSIFVFEASR